MMINLEYVKSLNPCADRLKNAEEHYKDLEISLHDFLDLNKITHQDKLWIYFRSIPQELIGKVAADLAEEVLHLYESVYPNDHRPRNAILAARNSGRNAADAAAAYTYASYAAYAAVAADSSMYSKQIEIMKKWLKEIK